MCVCDGQRGGGGVPQARLAVGARAEFAELVWGQTAEDHVCSVH